LLQLQDLLPIRCSLLGSRPRSRLLLPLLRLLLLLGRPWLLLLSLLRTEGAVLSAITQVRKAIEKQ
jgi:hypothetical protein